MTEPHQLLEPTGRGQVGLRAAVADQIASCRERNLLDLLDQRDGLALLTYVADLRQPPVIVGPEGEVIELPPPISPPPPLPSASPELEQALVSFRDEQEYRWCDENVPALGGITPRQAAADRPGAPSWPG